MKRVAHYYVSSHGRTISDYRSKKEAYKQASAIEDGSVSVEYRTEPEVLDLVLKAEWYDMIASGVKKEEYRELKPFYHSRLWSASKVSLGDLGYKQYDIVRFHRAYTNTTMDLEFKGIRIGRGKPEWGAPTDKDVYIISLGEIISKTA